MKYYAIKETDGKFWNGSIKLSSPPILVCNANEREAVKSRNRSEMENRIKKSFKPENYEVWEIESKNHKNLAD
jgi:hypothetical protein